MNPILTWVVAWSVTVARMADIDCDQCGGTGWLDGRRRNGIAHSMRAH